MRPGDKNKKAAKPQANKKTGARPKPGQKSRPRHRPANQAERAPIAGPMRIARAIARAGLCSRREAETWVNDGRISVNGKVLTSPALNVTPEDRIEVDGEPLPGHQAIQLYKFHKPAGLVTTHSDPEGRPTVFGALPDDLPRLISIGRLDFNTEGLLLLTNDGALARLIELPKTGWLRRYKVRAHGRINQARLDKLKDGITIDGVHYGAINAQIEREQGSNVWLTIGIREGKNREIRRVLSALDLNVNRLIRLSFGPFQLGDMKSGAVEEIPEKILSEQLGPRMSSELGLAPPPATEKSGGGKKARPKNARPTNDKRARPTNGKKSGPKGPRS